MHWPPARVLLFRLPELAASHGFSFYQLPGASHTHCVYEKPQNEKAGRRQRATLPRGPVLLGRKPSKEMAERATSFSVCSLIHLTDSLRRGARCLVSGDIDGGGVHNKKGCFRFFPFALLLLFFYFTPAPPPLRTPQPFNQSSKIFRTGLCNGGKCRQTPQQKTNLRRWTSESRLLSRLSTNKSFQHSVTCGLSRPQRCPIAYTHTHRQHVLPPPFREPRVIPSAVPAPGAVYQADETQTEAQGQGPQACADAPRERQRVRERRGAPPQPAAAPAAPAPAAPAAPSPSPSPAATEAATPCTNRTQAPPVRQQNLPENGDSDGARLAILVGRGLGAIYRLDGRLTHHDDALERGLKLNAVRRLDTRLTQHDDALERGLRHFSLLILHVMTMRSRVASGTFMRTKLSGCVLPQ